MEKSLAYKEAKLVDKRDKEKELLNYSQIRVDRCPFMETKTFCNSCKVHCYKADMRMKIKEVMKFSGPRLILHHPILLIKHGIDDLIYKAKQRKERRYELDRQEIDQSA